MGKTILELFKGSEKDINPKELDKAPYSDDETKQIDSQGIYYKDNLYKFGTNYSLVKSDKQTLIGQETSGIRVKSLVDINNPLIYGNEAGRISLRSTPLLEDMKSGTGGAPGNGGPIGGLISKARDFVNETIGIPQTQSPSRLVGKIDIGKANDNPNPSKLLTTRLENFAANNPNQVSDPHSQIPITKDIVGYNGTEVGKLLKETGGNPKTIAKQALGKGIGYAKDKLRGKLFGGSGTIGEALGDDQSLLFEWNNKNTYSSFMTDTSKKVSRNIYNEGGEIPPPSEPAIPFGNQSNTKIDLRLTSPVYGIGRRRYGNTTNSYIFLEGIKRKGERLPNYSPDSPFLGYGKHDKKTTLESVYGIGKGGYAQNIDTVSPSEEYSLDEDQAFIKVGDITYTDFIPVWFRKKGTEKPIVFRAILSGITETTSPSWSSNKFIGNPYSFYMYDGIERSLSFNIKLFATSEIVLSSIWERLKILTAYSYPTISQGLTTPPIIEFRLGSMYSGKTAFIENLTYTIPDDSNWETNGELGYLPKTVDVSISVKFIEQQGSEDRLYDFTISKEAAKAINEKREANAISGDPQTGEGEDQKPPKMTTKGDGKVKGIVKKIKTTNPLAGVNAPSIPADFQPGKINPKESQSGIADKLNGKTPTQAIKESENKSGIGGQQTYQLENLGLTGPKPRVIPQSGLPSFAKERVIGTNGAIFAKQSGYSPYTKTTIDTYWEIDTNGNVNFLGEQDKSLDAALGL